MKKGFTLIELLAVIVILAIIALIALPTITGVVEKAKQSAAKSSVLGYIDTLEKQIVISQIKNDNIINDGTYQLSNISFQEISFLNIIESVKAEEIEQIYLNDILKIKGKYPSRGFVTIEKGKVTYGQMQIDEYILEYNLSKKDIVRIIGNDKTPPTIKLGNINENTTSLIIPFTATSVAKVTCEYGIDKSYGSTGEINNSNNECAITGLPKGTKYYFRITALSASGKSVTATGEAETKGGPMLETLEQSSSENPNRTGLLGTVYLDPTNLSAVCDASNSVSTTGTKTGCMKWYIYNDNGENYTMILDHNTTPIVYWSSSIVPYESSGVKSVVDALVTESKWVVTPRLITADEVNTITKKTNFDSTKTSSYYFLDTFKQAITSYSDSNRSKYDWLFNNTGLCKTDSYDHGCTIEDNNSYSGVDGARTYTGTIQGYWTSSYLLANGGDNARVWVINYWGMLGYSMYYASNSSNLQNIRYGVRPVITVSKSIFS